MGQLDEYQKDERAVVDPAGEALDAAQFWADAQLGKKVREMLAGEEPPAAIRRSVRQAVYQGGEHLPSAWDWLRRELLGKGGAPSRAGGTAVEPEDDRVRETAKAIADRLFTNGFGERARHLVLQNPDGRGLGGWCFDAAVRQIEEALRGR